MRRVSQSFRQPDENEIVEFLRKRHAVEHPMLKKGIGDDAAVLRLGEAKEFQVITTDALIEEIDFRRDWTTPRELGWKSLAVNLSDLAAMGARPQFFTVTLALPPDITEQWIREFYNGLTECGALHGAALIGGDLSGAQNAVMISITAIGESLRRRVVYRSGGREGDLLYVTGTLGRSAAGLELLRQGTIHSRSRPRREALRAHRMPEPRCRAGAWLAQSGYVHSMMDISDGLSTDLARMCAASGVDAEILTAPVFAAAASWHCDPLALALHGGEDYELLFSAPFSKKGMLEKNYPSEFPPITHIGNMLEGTGVVWLAEPGKKRRELPALGFDHFRSASASSD